MVQLFVGGQAVGVIPDPDGLIAGLVARNQRAELRGDAGNRIAVLTPDAAPPDPHGPIVPWDPSITREELDRRAAGPGLTHDELRKQLGWA